jgi:hypothetical protein
MLVVLEVEKAGPDYDKILDILFLSVGLLNPSGMAKYSSPQIFVKLKRNVLLYFVKFYAARKDLEPLTAHAKVATALGSIPASADTAEFEGRQMKQC